VPAGGFLSGLNVDFQDGAIVKCFEFLGGFVGFDFCQDVATFDCVAFFFEPVDDGTRRHGVAQFGHFNEIGHCR